MYVVNLFSKIFGRTKKTNIFLNKKVKEGCFTLSNNIGYYSDTTLLDFDDAKHKYSHLNYSDPVYTLLSSDGIYLSYDKKYNPVISNRVYRHEDNVEITYRWIKTDEDGKILKSVLLNKTLK